MLAKLVPREPGTDWEAVRSTRRGGPRENRREEEACFIRVAVCRSLIV